MRSLILGMAIGLGFPAWAEIYETKDAQGNPSFSDEAPLNKPAKEVELPPTNTVEMATPAAKKSDGDNSSQQDDAKNGKSSENSKPFSVLAIANTPNDDESMRDNDGTFNLNVNVQPALTDGQQLQLVLDGQNYGSPVSGTTIPVKQLDRGEHSLQVNVVVSGQVVQSSAPVTFTLHRAHVRHR